MPQCLSIRTTKRVFIAVLDVFLSDMAILAVHPVFFSYGNYSLYALLTFIKRKAVWFLRLIFSFSWLNQASFLLLWGGVGGG